MSRKIADEILYPHPINLFRPLVHLSSLFSSLSRIPPTLLSALSLTRRQIFPVMCKNQSKNVCMTSFPYSAIIPGRVHLSTDKRIKRFSFLPLCFIFNSRHMITSCACLLDAIIWLHIAIGVDITSLEKSDIPYTHMFRRRESRSSHY